MTRRVAQRVFLLTPTTLSRELVEYCFARARATYPGIELHSLQVLSNHYHATLTDHDGSLPDFMAWVDRELAKALNAHYERSENFWSSEHYSAVDLLDAPTVWGKLLYVFTNVVKALLVRDYREWPGVRSTPQDWLAGPKMVKRPTWCFNQKDEQWAEVPLQFTIPPQFRDRDPALVVAEMDAAIAEEQRRVVAEAKRKDRAFVGAERISKQSPFAVPKSPSTKGKLNPTFAAGTPEGHVRAREERKSFLSLYREALEQLRRGLRPIFPAGAYLWPRLLGLECAPVSTAHVLVDSA